MKGPRPTFWDLLGTLPGAIKDLELQWIEAFKFDLTQGEGIFLIRKRF
jgi:hypothetical protein